MEILTSNLPEFSSSNISIEDGDVIVVTCESQTELDEMALSYQNMRSLKDQYRAVRYQCGEYSEEQTLKDIDGLDKFN